MAANGYLQDEEGIDITSDRCVFVVQVISFHQPLPGESTLQDGKLDFQRVMFRDSVDRIPQIRNLILRVIPTRGLVDFDIAPK